MPETGVGAGDGIRKLPTRRILFPASGTDVPESEGVVGGGKAPKHGGIGPWGGGTGLADGLARRLRQVEGATRETRSKPMTTTPLLYLNYFLAPENRDPRDTVRRPRPQLSVAMSRECNILKTYATVRVPASDVLVGSGDVAYPAFLRGIPDFSCCRTDVYRSRVSVAHDLLRSSRATPLLDPSGTGSTATRMHADSFPPLAGVQFTNIWRSRGIVNRGVCRTFMQPQYLSAVTWRPVHMDEAAGRRTQ